MDGPEVDALYAEAPETFVRARDALAKELGRAGDRDRAAAVKALRKPTITAWALNQLSRARTTDVEHLVATGEELRAAQRDALEGGDPDRLRDARRAYDDAVDELAALAERMLSDSGRPAGPTVRDRLTATLRAAGAGDEARDLLRAGRLVTELEPSGFGFGDDVAHGDLPAPARPRPAPSRRAPARGPRPAAPSRPEPEVDHAAVAREARQLATAADRAEARAVRTAREAEQAEHTAVELRRAADEARGAAIEARRRADAAHERTSGTGPVR
jgi:hypothetical protein